MPHHSTGPSATLTIAFAAAATERIHFMLAHRPGFTAPTLAARQIATLDQFSRGRLAVHFISGGSDSEQQRDGDFLDHDARYAHRRIPRHPPTNLDRSAAVRSRRCALPVQTGVFGSEAVPAAACADLFRRRIGSGARSGRQARGRLRAVGRIARPGARPDHARARRSREAWPPGALLRVVPPDPRRDRRRSLGARASHPRRNAPVARSGRPRPAARSRAKARAACSPRPNAARASTSGWTEIAKLTGARSNSTALVGTPEQVADALLDYYDLGVTTFLIRGFDPLEDAIDYGRELIPRVRSAVAARDALQRSLLEPSAIMSAVLASPIRTTSGLELAEAPRQHFWFDPPAPRIDVAAERRHRQERLAGAFRLFARFGFSSRRPSPHATPSCPTTSG